MTGEFLVKVPMIHNSTGAVTGCLQERDDEYVLLADDGNIWELKDNSVKLDGQTGHTVIRAPSTGASETARNWEGSSEARELRMRVLRSSVFQSYK